MPIPPSLIGGGLSGWVFLKETLPRQQETFAKSPDIQREEDRFRETFSEPVPLTDFIRDTRTLGLALDAFGLGEEVDKRAFIRRIVEDGPDDPQGFARRLNSSEFISFASTFRVDDEGNISLSSDQIDDIITRARQTSFEEAVGEQDEDLRLALNFSDEISTLAQNSSSDRSFWFRVLGTAPLRSVMQTSFSLPDGFNSLDVDKQVDILSDRAERQLGGNPREILATPDGNEKMVRRFLLQSQLENGVSGYSSASAALTLLSGGIGSAGLTSLVLSNG